MPSITIRADESSGEGRATLTESVVATNLRDEHYAAQLIERLTWATSDAEALEVAAEHADADKSAGTHADGATRTGSGRSRSHTRPRVSYLGPRA